MPKRAARPWERGIGRRDDDFSPSKKNGIPYVKVDGIPYFSDRFYLHRPAQAPDPAVAPTSNGCMCGARGPPPLFDRGRLVQSLELQAAIVATYTLGDPSWMRQEFPSLFDGSIPTLVLHGHKGLTTVNDEGALQKAGSSLDPAEAQSPLDEHRPDLFLPEPEVSTSLVNGKGPFFPSKTESSSSLPAKMLPSSLNREVICIDDSSDEDDKPMPNGNTESSATAAKLQHAREIEPVTSTMTVPNKLEEIPSANIMQNGLESAVKQEEEELPPEEAWLHMSSAQPSLLDLPFGNSVHLTEILPAWLPPRTYIPTREQQDVVREATLGINREIVSRRQAKRGVHHPKFMILFEKRGSVVVVVSSANLTKVRSTDASWVQRFEPAETNMDRPKVTNQMRMDGSDFGHVLANFLQCQSDAVREGQMLPQEFLQRYLRMASLDDFRRRYRFEETQVHLIATVPGDYRGRHSCTHLGRFNGKPRAFLYGPQRVADILARLGPECSTATDENTTPSSSKPWLPSRALSDQDRLIFQPTSFGGNWTRENLADIARSYFACDDRQQGAMATAHKDDELLERVDIVWPSQDFMDGVQGSKGNGNRLKSPDSGSDVAGAVEAHNGEYGDRSSSESNGNGGFIFLSSKSFNTIDLHCISRMAMYESSIPQQIPCVLSPHIKTYGRMFEGNEYNLRKHYGVGKAEECFSWFMLSSACFSLGAQGKALPHRGLESDEMTYANFELGVLFCSRLQGKRSSDRLYCWKPNQCMCSRSYSKGASMVHLPIPYCLRPPPYQSDPDEADMCATPYFHEIPKGTGCVGQMKLTPLGAKLASSLS